MTDLAEDSQRADALPLGPGSLVWKYFGDNRMYLIGPRPAVLQNMLGELGQGVLDHSVFFSDIAARVKRSIPPIMMTVYPKGVSPLAWKLLSPLFNPLAAFITTGGMPPRARDLLELPSRAGISSICGGVADARGELGVESAADALALQQFRAGRLCPRLTRRPRFWTPRWSNSSGTVCSASPSTTSPAGRG